MASIGADTGGPLIFVHSSDESYGADQIVLDLFSALPVELRGRAEFWLPTDLTHGEAPLCQQLEARGARVRHLDLPILRRAYRSPRQLLALAGRAARLVREIRTARPAMVYCTTSAAFLAGPPARLAGVPHLVGHVQEIWSRGDTRALGPLARAFPRLIAISEPVRDGLPEHLQRRTSVILNATPEPAEQEPLAGREGALAFLVASRWNGWKGHRTLLTAWDRLESPGRLVVLGGAPPTGESVDVPTLARGLRRPDSVEVVGEVPDLDPYLQAADVVVVPSDNPEPFGLVAIEAFSRGRPVVGSDGGGLADIITHGQDGWLFPLGDADRLAELLAGLTRAEVNRAGAQARATYERRFTADRYAEQWRRATGIRT